MATREADRTKQAGPGAEVTEQDASVGEDRGRGWSLPLIGRFDRDMARRAMPYILLVGLIVYFSVRAPSFHTVDNLENIVRQGGVLLIVSLGMTFVILQGGIDLSVGSIATLAGVLVTQAVADMGVGLAAFPIGAAIGVAVGIVTGVIVAYMRVPSFLVTLGMLSVVAGISDYISNGTSQSLIDSTVTTLVSGSSILGVPNLLWWAIVAMLIALFAERFTTFGRYSYAIGGDEHVTALAGVPTRRYKLYAFVGAGLTAGVAGAMLAASTQGAGPGLGAPLMLQAITAVAIGGTALTGGIGGVMRTLLGVTLITILDNGMILTDVGAYTQEIITGVVLIVAVGLSLDRRRLQVIK